MSAIRSRGMKPELRVRRAAHLAGYRFRLHCNDLPGKPDLVFAGRNKVIFVHGCFWHQHRNCVDGRLPKSNRGYWKPKLARNVERDAEHIVKLRKSGWKVLVVWECQTANEHGLTLRLKRFLS